MTRNSRLLPSAVLSTMTTRLMFGLSSAATLCSSAHCSFAAPGGVSQRISQSPCFAFDDALRARRAGVRDKAEGGDGGEKPWRACENAADAEAAGPAGAGKAGSGANARGLMLCEDHAVSGTRIARLAPTFKDYSRED